jgi:hypothetical protein
MKALSHIFNIEHIEIDYSDMPLSRYNSEISRQEAIQRNSVIVSCPHCGVKGNEPNMLRWHFDNCDTHLRNCLQCGNTIPRQGIKNFLYDKKVFCNRSCYMKSKRGKSPINMTEDVKKKISQSRLGKSSNNQHTKGRKIDV